MADLSELIAECLGKFGILVCGGRGFDEAEAGELVLAWAEQKWPDGARPDMHFIHGDCRGADQGAVIAAGVLAGKDTDFDSEIEVGIESFPADWKKNGRAAGPIRNKKMAARAKQFALYGEGAVVLALPGGKGTANMVKLAKAALLDVVEFQ